MKKVILFSFLMVCSGLILISCRQTTEPVVDNGIRYAVLLKVSSPESEDVYYPGNKVKIEWNILSKMRKMTIQLYRKSDFIMTIAPEVDNTGNFTWTIPADIEQSHHYKVRVSNFDNSTQYADSDVFYILLY